MGDKVHHLRSAIWIHFGNRYFKMKAGGGIKIDPRFGFIPNLDCIWANCKNFVFVVLCFNLYCFKNICIVKIDCIMAMFIRVWSVNYKRLSITNYHVFIHLKKMIHLNTRVYWINFITKLFNHSYLVTRNWST